MNLLHKLPGSEPTELHAETAIAGTQILFRTQDSRDRMKLHQLCPIDQTCSLIGRWDGVNFVVEHAPATPPPARATFVASVGQATYVPTMKEMVEAGYRDKALSRARDFDQATADKLVAEHDAAAAEREAAFNARRKELLATPVNKLKTLAGELEVEWDRQASLETMVGRIMEAEAKAAAAGAGSQAGA